MKRAQTAVPAVLLTTMALIIWYVLWLYPQQRYELLFGTEPEEVISEGLLDSSFLRTTVGEIGQSSGELLDTQIVSDLSVSYPETRSTISSFDSQIITASIIASGHKTVDLTTLDSDKVNVEVLASSVVGSPKLRITLNNTLIYDNELIADSKTSVDISKASLETYGRILRITCQYNGWQFWTTQQCGFNSINVYDYVYAPVDLTDSDVFYLTPNSENAELIELTFTPTRVSEHQVSIQINGVNVFTGALQAEETTLSLEGDEVNLGIDNNITLLALEGADYVLTDVGMKFYSVPSGLAAKYLVFDVPERTLRREDSVTLTFDLTGIVEPGDVNIDVLNTGVKYLLTRDELVLGANRVDLLTSDLEEYGNNIKIYSTSGRLIIGEIVIE
ncbi:MAG: hypothetical protein JW791_05035 [Nanoarchaeota archaeon]|nr:hypothetical protein [Nanoarchaeota archaeon]